MFSHGSDEAEPCKKFKLLDTLITSKTRVKLLLRLFLNPNSKGYLQGLASEFGESSNAIRVELNRFDEAGLLDSNLEGRRKMYQANHRHPMFTDIQNILKKFVGIDKIVENIAQRIGDLEEVYLEGSLAEGRDTEVIDLVLVGDDIDRSYTAQIVEKAESLLKKRIRYLVVETTEAKTYFQKKDKKSFLLVWHK